MNIGNNSGHVQILRKKIDKIVSLADSYEEIEKNTIKKLWEQFQERFQMMSEVDKEMEFPKEGRYSSAQIVEAKKNTSGSLVEIIQYAGSCQ